MTSTRHLVVIPTYNEGENLVPIATALLRSPEAELLIIDDCSPDGTGEIAAALARREPRVHLIRRPRKLGQGSAYVEGLRVAWERGYPHVVQMDCDASHDPADVPRLLAELERGEADVAVGSRYVRGGRAVGWGLRRRVLSWAGNQYARLLLSGAVRDWTSGFKALTRAAVQNLLRCERFAEGYAFHIEVTSVSLAAGLRVTEVPIVFRDRVAGESKLGHGIIVEAATRVWSLRRTARSAAVRGAPPGPPRAPDGRTPTRSATRESREAAPSRGSLPTCPLCESAASPHHDQGFRRVVRCRGCSFVWVDPIPTAAQKAAIEHRAFAGEMLAESKHFFDAYGREFPDDEVVANWRQVVAELTRHSDPGRLLDVGAGTGLFLHLAREAGWAPTGIEMVAPAAERAATEFGLEVEVGDFATHPFPPLSFDAITLLDVLEHCVDPGAILRRAHTLVRPGGLICVSVPNQRSLLTFLVDCYARLRAPGRRYLLDRIYVEPHLYYFDGTTLGRGLEAAGWEVVRTTPADVPLCRYDLGIVTKLALAAVLRVGRLVGRSGRICIVGRRPAVPAPVGG